MKTQNWKLQLTVGFLAVSLPAVTSAFQTAAFAQPPGDNSFPRHAQAGQVDPSSTPPVAQRPTSDTNLHSVPPRSLMSQRLHPAVLPTEAELRCGTDEPCIMGLTRGFAVGGDVSGMLVTNFLRHQSKPGAWVFYDGFAGYQFLQAVEDRFYSSGTVGYRGFSYEDSMNRKFETKGFTFRIAYAQDITPAWSQGLVFNLFGNGKTSFSDNLKADLLPIGAGQGARDSLERYAEFARKYPNIRLGLPADIEVINWKASHIDLPNHLRGYVRLEPFYIQNSINFGDAYTWQDKAWGLRLATTASYVSEKEKAGRYALLASIGADLSATSTKATSNVLNKNQLSATGLDELPHKELLEFYLNLEASYQF